MWIMFIPHRKHTYGPPRTVNGISLLFICGLCSYLSGNTAMGFHGLLWGMALLYLYVDDVCTSQEAYRTLWPVNGERFPLLHYRLVDC
jgi:hypothetical protein